MHSSVQASTRCAVPENMDIPGRRRWRHCASYSLSVDRLVAVLSPLLLVYDAAALQFICIPGCNGGTFLCRCRSFDLLRKNRCATLRAALPRLLRTFFCRRSAGVLYRPLRCSRVGILYPLTVGVPAWTDVSSGCFLWVKVDGTCL